MFAFRKQERTEAVGETGFLLRKMLTFFHIFFLYS